MPVEEPATVTAVEITIQGRLPEDLVDAFGAGTTSETPEETVLVTPWTDQAGLFELLCRLRDLGLEVTEVRRTADER